MKKIFYTICCTLLANAMLHAQTQATLLGNWDDPALVGSAAYDNTYNEVWSLAWNGREYGVIGSTAGTHFIDVTDPTNPVEVAFVQGGLSNDDVIHRDFKDYAGYLYGVCDEGVGQSTFQIIDYRFLPDSVSLVYNSQSLFSTTHNIYIDTATAKAYACFVRRPGFYTPLMVLDLTNPVAPVEIAHFGAVETSAFSQVHDAFVRNDTAYLNCGPNGLVVADFSDATNPTLLDAMPAYPFQGYNHSGWMHPTEPYYYMADENHGYDMKVIDCSDVNNLSVLGTFNAGLSAPAATIPHNQLTHDGRLYVAYYYDGLQVYDLGNPAQPERSFFYDTYTPPSAFSYKGAWGVNPFLPSGNILLSDMQTGLYIFQSLDSIPLLNTGTRNLDAQQSLSVSPNPFEHTILINSHLDTETWAQVQLLDLSGRVLASQYLLIGAQQQVPVFNDLDALGAGMYLLQIRGDALNMSIKLMK